MALLGRFLRAKKLNFRIFSFCNFSAFSCASLQRRGFCPKWRPESIMPWLCERFECVVAGLDSCTMFLRLAGTEFFTIADF